MSNISNFNRESNAEIEHEHEVQLGLLQALCSAVREERDAAVVAELLDHLAAYSEAHFVSEEMLMRLKSYDEYEDHVADHVKMLEALRQIAADHAAGNSSLVSGKVENILGFLSNHIATRDRRFADFVRSGQ